MAGKSTSSFESSIDKSYPWERKSKLSFVTCTSSRSYLVQCVLAAAMTGSFIFGFNLSLLNTSISTIGAQFRWCGYQGYTGCTEYKLKAAFIQSAVFIGAAIGALSAGKFIGKFGTRKCFFIADVVVFVGAIFSTAANTFTSLLLSRGLGGIGVGILAVAVPTYISEITPPSSRGFYGIFHQLFVTVGILAGVLIGLPLSFQPQPVVPADTAQPTPLQMGWIIQPFYTCWWRLMLAAGIFPVIVSAVFFQYIFRHETPYFYMKRGRHGEAKRLLTKLSCSGDRDQILTDFNEIAAQADTASRSKVTGLNLSAILRSKQARKALLVGSGLSAFQQLSGINVFITSSNLLFASAGLTSNLVTVMSIILTLVNSVMTIPTIFLVDRIGRRLLFLIGSIGMAAATLPGCILLWVDQDALYSSWTAITGAIVFIIFFSATWGPVVWVYIFEITPIEMKDSAGGFMTAINWVAGVIMVFAGSFLETRVAYIIFTGFNILGALFVLFFVKETKGRRIGDSPYFTGNVATPDMPAAELA